MLKPIGNFDIYERAKAAFLFIKGIAANQSFFNSSTRVGLAEGRFNHHTPEAMR
jgi:hypothetical protein